MKVLIAVGVCAMLASTAVSGHHSFAAVYFEEQRISIEGAIVQFEFRAPHAWVHVKIASGAEDGQVYAAEWNNPNRLTRDNITADTLKPGDVVRITGSPARDRSTRRLHLKAIERPADGWTWGNRSRPAPGTAVRPRG